VAQNDKGVRSRWRVPPPYATETECALLQVISSSPLRAFPPSLLTSFPLPLAAAFRMPMRRVLSVSGRPLGGLEPPLPGFRHEHQFVSRRPSSTPARQHKPANVPFPPHIKNRSPVQGGRRLKLRTGAGLLEFRMQTDRANAVQRSDHVIGHFEGRASQPRTRDQTE